MSEDEIRAFDSRIAQIYRLGEKSETVALPVEVPMNVRNAEFQAMAECFLGAYYDQKKLLDVENSQNLLHNQREDLLRQYRAGNLSPEEYVDAVNSLIATTVARCESVLGPADFEKLFGTTSDSLAGYIDKNTFLAIHYSERNLLSGLRELREGFARALASVIDVAVSDGLRVAELAPVASLGSGVWTKFQIPLKLYFEQILHLSGDIVRQWAPATLVVQKHHDALRFILNSPPEDWALAVSFDDRDISVLDINDRVSTIPGTCVDTNINHCHMAFVPFQKSL